MLLKLAHEFSTISSFEIVSAEAENVDYGLWLISNQL